MFFAVVKRSDNDAPPVGTVRDVPAEQRKRDRGQRLEKPEPAERERTLGQYIDLIPDHDDQRSSTQGGETIGAQQITKLR